MANISNNSIFSRRWHRFCNMKRAWLALLCLIILYIFSLGAELFCNDKPLLIRQNGNFYFPILKNYPEDTWLHNGAMTSSKYLDLKLVGAFNNPSTFILWPLCQNSPYSQISIQDITPYLTLKCRIAPIPQVAGITLGQDNTIISATNLDIFIQNSDNCINKKLSDFWDIPPELSEAIDRRWNLEPDSRQTIAAKGVNGAPDCEIILAATARRDFPRANIRLRIIPQGYTLPDAIIWHFNPRDLSKPLENIKHLNDFPLPQITEIATAALANQDGTATGICTINNHPYKIYCEMETPRFPFRPIPGHWLGIDDAGRDVFARLLYGLRIALNFGLILVICSLIIGSAVGMLQGYLGGWYDIGGQRFIEIWSALPFLYIMILLGSIYGSSFTLLLICYAIFNWIGISYYMRGEMLRLKHSQFVESAKCLGLPGWKIILRHILPNSLVPIITFFPFSLVGAIGSLAALDYLGFGLPSPTPSIGQLLQQAQVQRECWWLILYPSLLLFIIMLCGVLIGEGVRNAFDPRRQNRLK